MRVLFTIASSALDVSTLPRVLGFDLLAPTDSFGIFPALSFLSVVESSLPFPTDTVGRFGIDSLLFNFDMAALVALPAVSLIAFLCFLILLLLRIREIPPPQFLLNSHCFMYLIVCTKVIKKTKAGSTRDPAIANLNLIP